MATAMNRSVANIIVGGFGSNEGTQTSLGGAEGAVREVSVDDAAIQLAYASKVIIVPGYGLAGGSGAARRPRAGGLLEARGIEVSYAIHPVAGTPCRAI